MPVTKRATTRNVKKENYKFIICFNSTELALKEVEEYLEKARISWPKGKGFDEELALTYLAHRGYKPNKAIMEIYRGHSEFKQMRKIHRNGKKILKHEVDELNSSDKEKE